MRQIDWSKLTANTGTLPNMNTVNKVASQLGSSVIQNNETSFNDIGSNGTVLRSLSEMSVVTVVENDGSLRAPPEGRETIVLATLDNPNKRQNVQNVGINVI
jgi:hypothetical protein